MGLFDSIGKALFGDGGAKKQRRALQQSTQQAIAAQREFFGKAEQAVQPFMQAGARSIGLLGQAISGLGSYPGQFNALRGQARAELTPILDQLLSQTGTNAETRQAYQQLKALGAGPDFSFDPNDPAYQFKRQELAKSINQQLASIGLRRSGRGLGVLSHNMQGLLAEEVDLQRQRTLEDFLTKRSTLAQRVGLSSDLQQRAFGRGLSSFGANVSSLDMQRGLMQSALNAQLGQVGALQNLVGTGAAAASSLGGFAGGAGANIAQAQLGLGQGIANTYQQEYSNAMGGLGTLIMGAGLALGGPLGGLLAQKFATPQSGVGQRVPTPFENFLSTSYMGA